MRQFMIVVGNTLVRLYVSVGSGRRTDGEGRGTTKGDAKRGYEDGAHWLCRCTTSNEGGGADSFGKGLATS